MQGLPFAFGAAEIYAARSRTAYDADVRQGFAELARLAMGNCSSSSSFNTLTFHLPVVLFRNLSFIKTLEFLSIFCDIN